MADAPGGAFLRHFLAQKGTGIAAMRHCFGPKRRSNRRDGEKTCWRSRLGVAYLCTKWRMVTHRGTRGNSRSRLKNRRKIGDWLAIPEFPPAAGSLPAEQGALCAADSFACVARRGNSREFRLGADSIRFSDMAAGRPRRLTRRTGPRIELSPVSCGARPAHPAAEADPPQACIFSYDRVGSRRHMPRSSPQRTTL